MQYKNSHSQFTQQERRELSSLLFNVIRDALLIFNEHGNIVEANTAACDLYQFEYEELIGLHGYNLISQSNHYLFDEFIETVSNEKCFSAHSKDTTKNGRIFDAEIKGLPFKFHNKKFLLAIVRDVSDKKKAVKQSKANLKKYQQLLQHIPDVIWTTNQNGKTMFITENIEDVFGYNPEEIYQNKSLWFKHIHPEDVDNVKKAFEKLFTHNTPFDVEYRLQTKDGKWIWVSDRSTSVYEYNDTLVADGVLSDITQHKRIQAELVQSEKRFKSLFENAPDAYYINDFDGKLIDGNKEAEKLLGYNKKELIGKKISDLGILPKKYIPKAIKNLLAAKKGKATGPDEFELHRKDGSTIIAEINTIPVTLNGKNVVLGVAHDITNRKETEFALREAKESFETIFNTMADPVMILDKTGKFVELTDKVKDYTGFEKSEILGKNFLKTKLLTPKSKAACIKNLVKRMAGVDVKPYEVEALTKDGEKIPFEVNAQRITYKGKPADLVVFRDISNRVQAEQKLRQSEKTYRNLFQNAQVGLFRTNLKDGRILECNNQIANMFGFKNREEFIEKYQLEKFYVNPIDRTELVEKLKKDGFVNHFEAAFYRKDKTVFWARYSAKYNKKHNWIEGVFEDITELKKAENRLKKNHEQLKQERKQLLSIFDSINHAIYVADPNTYEILFTNSKLRDSLKQDVTGKKCYEALQKKNQPCEFCTNEIILKNKGKAYKWEYHNPYTQKDYELTDKIITWPDGRSVRFELAVDITERKKALEEIKKAHETVSAFNRELEEKVKQKTARIENLLKQKDEFINQLGHDLKNPLGPLLNLLPVVENHVPDEKYKKMLQVAQRNVGYMKNLVVKTIELAKLNSPNTEFSFEEINLFELVETIIESNMLSSNQKNIHLLNKIPDHLFIYADQLRMQELFNNLINNAIKYTESNGFVQIKADEKTDSILISIADNGLGMSEEQLTHLFDEFYKADESRHDFESSGLGMPICKRIVEKHDGKIWAESKGLGNGSTIFISLPYKNNKVNVGNKESNKPKTDYKKIIEEVDQLIEQNL